MVGVGTNTSSGGLNSEMAVLRRDSFRHLHLQIHSEVFKKKKYFLFLHVTSLECIQNDVESFLKQVLSSLTPSTSVNKDLVSYPTFLQSLLATKVSRLVSKHPGAGLVVMLETCKKLGYIVHRSS